MYLKCKGKNILVFVYKDGYLTPLLMNIIWMFIFSIRATQNNKFPWSESIQNGRWMICNTRMIVSTVFRIQTFVICYVIIRQVWQLIARRLVIIILSRCFSSPLVSKMIIGTILCLVVRTIGRNRYTTCQFIWLVRLLEDNVIFVGMILYVWVFCRPNSKGGSSSCCVLFLYIFLFPKKIQ